MVSDRSWYFVSDNYEQNVEGTIMRRKLRTIGIWILIVSVAVAAFVLALDVTSQSFENETKMDNIVIDLDQNVYDEVTTEEESGFWQYPAGAGR